MNDSSAFVPMLGQVLLHFVWQGAAIGAAAALTLHVLRAARPQVRYAVACTALLACAIAPLATLAVLALQTQAATPADAAPGHAAGVLVAAGNGVAAVLSVDTFDPHSPWLRMLVALWASGASVFLIRMAMGTLWIQRARSAVQPPSQARWQARVDALATRFGLRRRVTVLLVDELDSPVSAGWLRPVVLMPACLLSRMPLDLVEALLAHELAHIRRHDYLVNLLQGLVEALLFYHPMVWWLSRRVRIEREHIADRLAADVTGDARRLALALAELAELADAHPAPRPSPHFAQSANGGQLMARIEQLVRPGRHSAGNRIALPLLGIAAACVAFYAHARIESPPLPALVSAATSVNASAPTLAAPSKPLPQSAGVVAEALGLDAPARATARVDANAVADAVASARAEARTAEEPYALVRDGSDGMLLSGSTDDIDEIKAIRGGMSKDFIWFRRNGQAYTVTDPALLARARRAWEPSQTIAQRMEVLSREMEAHGERMNRMGAEMGTLSAPMPHVEIDRDAQRRIGQLAGRQGRLAAQHARLSLGLGGSDEVQEAKLEAQMEGLEAQIEVLEAEIEREADRIEAQAERVARNSAPIEALGRRMEEAAKPMEALGRRMDALGKEHERHAARGDAELRAVIREAIDKGHARPATGVAPDR